MRVRYGTYESNPEMLAKVMSGNSGWDVVFPSAEFIQPMRDMGLLAPLRSRRGCPTSSALDPQFQQPPWDPELRLVRSLHARRHRNRLSEEPRAGAAVPGPICGTRGWRESSPCSTIRRKSWARASRSWAIRSTPAIPTSCSRRSSEAIAQKPLLRAYLNAEVRDQLVAGDVAAAQAWAVTAAQAIAAAPGQARVRFPGRGLPALRRQRGDPAREPARRSRASLHQLSAAPASRRGDRRGDAHRHARMPQRSSCPAGVDRARIRCSIRPPKCWRAENGSSRRPRRRRSLRDRLWTEIKSS